MSSRHELLDDDDVARLISSERYVVGPHVGGVVRLDEGEDNNIQYRHQGISSSSAAGSLLPLSKKRRKKRKKPSLFSLYHSDEEEDGYSSGDGEALDDAESLAFSSVGGTSAVAGAATSSSTAAYVFEPYELGMDINILINQVHQNVLRSLCLDDYEGLGCFGDVEMTCLAASLRHNTSLVSLQLRYLPVTDVSLVPLCKSLEAHPSLRALDLSGTKGTKRTSAALRHLACTNTNLLHVMVEETMLQEADKRVIEEAVQYNAMLCPDPRSNPFDLKMISKISQMEKASKELDQQLNYNPWLQGPPPSSELARGTGDGESSAAMVPRKKKVGFQKGRAEENESSILSQQVCGDYVMGTCKYGSRCKFYHPPRTAALNQVAVLQKYQAEEEQKKKWGSISARSSAGGSSSVAASEMGGAMSSVAPTSECGTLRTTKWEEMSDFAPSSAAVRSTTKSRRPGAQSVEVTLDTRKLNARRSTGADANAMTTNSAGADSSSLPNAAAAAGGRLSIRFAAVIVVVCCCSLVIAAAAAHKRRSK